MNRLGRLLRSLFFLPLLLVGGLSPGERAVAAPPANVGDWRFGVIESFEDPAAATALGASWTRVVFQWADVQPGGAGTWTPKVSDAQIDQEINSGRTVVGLLVGIPGWAVDGNGLPRGLWLPHDDPGNAWATFVREAVSRYQGRINHWIIWNEPDIGSEAIAHTWGGSVEDFFQLQRTAYLAAKEINPAAVIHLAAFTFWADANAGREQYMARLLDQILADPAAPAHNYYFDVATAHLYFQTTQVYDLLQIFLGLMRQRGMSQPIWLVETNVPPFDDPAWPVANPFLAATLDEQAAFMPQVMASALAAGAQRIAIYKLKDTETDRAANPEPFGLMRLDGSRRPAFTTYRNAIRYLSGAANARRERWDAVGQFRIDQGNKTTTVLFSRLPIAQRAQVRAEVDTAILIDMWGSSGTITARDGLFSVDLPGAACTQLVGAYCMVGGATYYLVQSEERPAPTDTPSATPSATPTTRPTDTVTPTATPTQNPTSTITPTATETALPAPSSTATIPPAPPTATATVVQSTKTADPQSPTPVASLKTSSDQGQGAVQVSGWILAIGIILSLGLAVGYYVYNAR